jgi:hypothetical protein
MSYTFAGFFVAQPLPRPRSLPPRAVWREVSSPFQGVGVLLPELNGKTVRPEQVHAVARELGITDAMPWLFLQYDTWAGDIDFVYRMGASAGTPFGPVEESEQESVEAAYLEVMAKLGVAEKEARNFAPFKRGFWSEQ